MSSDPGRGVRRPPTDTTRCGPDDPSNGLPVDAVFDALASETRRHLLSYLVDEAGGEATPSAIADRLCSMGVGAADREVVLVGLYHRHLPKLAELGLIEYDGPDGPVRYRCDPLVEECLTAVAVRDVAREP